MASDRPNHRPGCDGSGAKAPHAPTREEVRTMTNTAPVAMPSKPGIPDHIIEFATPEDRLLFEQAVNLAHDLQKRYPSGHPSLSDCMRIVFDVAALLAPCTDPMNYADDFTMWIMKGVASPLVAAMAVQRRETGSDCRFHVHHVWLRTSIANANYRDADYIIDNGTPGRGGSYKATIVVPEGCTTGYDVDVKVEPVRGCVTKQWAESWREFTESLLCEEEP